MEKAELDALINQTKKPTISVVQYNITIYRAIINLAQILDIKTLVEYIEEIEIYKIIKDSHLLSPALVL